jgi:integrase
MSAWVFQDPKQVKKRGPAKASWYCGWFDPGGKKHCKSCGPGAQAKRIANKLKEKIEAELLTGTYEEQTRSTWKEFRAEYKEKKLAGTSEGNRVRIQVALDHFERLIKPAYMRGIKSVTIADYVARRRQEPGGLPGSLVSPATINAELAHLRAALRKARQWDYLTGVPEFEFLKVPQKLPTYVPPEEFAILYQACEHARIPRKLPYPTADWWRALLVMAYMTGWRIGQLLGIRRDDVDLESGSVITRWSDNKGKRDKFIILHPLVVEHLLKIPGFDQYLFPWSYSRRTIFDEFARIQRLGGIHLDGPKDHYGFHDLRRAFATMNADRMTPDALQALMQHKDYQTTQRYINMARQLKPTAHALFVPDLPLVQAK